MKRILSMYFACLLFTLLYLTPDQAIAQPRVVPVIDSGEIPFEYIKNAIFLKVKINGESYRFILDTGGILTVSKRLRRQYNFELAGAIEVSDVNKNSRDLEMVMVPEIKIGNWTLNNQKALVDIFSDSYPSTCFDSDGMIGRDFFQGKILQLDFQKKVLRITNDPSKLDMTNARKGKFKLKDQGIPYFETLINGKKTFIEFDSGSGDFFSYGNKEASKAKIPKGKEMLLLEGVFSFGVTSRKLISSRRYIAPIASVELSDYHFENFYTQVSKPSQSRFGASLIKYGILTIDYQKKEFYFKPFEPQAEVPTFETFGFDLANINETFVIKWVLKGSEAEKAGLVFGQEVIAINGKTADQLKDRCDSYLNGYDFYTREKVEIVVKEKSGQEKSVSLEKLKY